MSDIYSKFMAESAELLGEASRYRLRFNGPAQALFKDMNVEFEINKNGEILIRGTTMEADGQVVFALKDNGKALMFQDTTAVGKGIMSKVEGRGKTELIKQRGRPSKTETTWYRIGSATQDNSKPTVSIGTIG